MKIIKNMKTWIIIIAILDILSIILGIVSSFKTNAFETKIDDIYSTVGGKDFIKGFDVTFPKLSIAISVAIFGSIILFIFIIFGFIYSFGKNEDNSLRKWPYIVLIVFSVLTILVFIFSILIKKSIGKMPISINENVDSAFPSLRADINKVWEDGYRTTVVISYIIRLIIILAILASSILMLFLIKIKKNNMSDDYSVDHKPTETVFE